MALAPEVTVRRAKAADVRPLFEWRNDPLTRAMSRAETPVSWDVHELWFNAIRADPQRPVFVGRAGNRDIGMVRFDIDGDTAEVAMTVAPEARGQGLAAPLLVAAIRAFRRTRRTEITARILAENGRSRRAFEAAGFRRIDEADGVLHYHHGAR